jgi:hypothetical protein
MASTPTTAGGLNADQLAARNAFLDPDVKPKSVLVEHKGKKLEVRQPTLGVRNVIQRSARVELDPEQIEAAKKGGSERVRVQFDFGKMQIGAVIACTYFPGTDVKVFNDIDAPALERALAGGGIDKLVDAAMAMVNVKQVDVEKNSETTQS